MSTSSAHSASGRSTFIGLGAPVAAGALLAVSPLVTLAGIAAGCVLLLAFVSVEAFVFTFLLSRNLASGHADLIVGAGLNAGALIGLGVLAATALRLGRMRTVHGLAWALVLTLGLVVWLAVGFSEFSTDPSLTREFVRSLSVIALAVIAANAGTGKTRDRLLSAVLLAAVLPAAIAVSQMVTGGIHTRAVGTFAHPNEAAAVFSVVLALSLWRLLETRDARLYLPLVCLFAIALLGTQSLGGVAGALVILLTYALLTAQFRTRSFVAIAACICFIIVFLLSPSGSQRVAELKTTKSFSVASHGVGYTTNSLDWRFYNWAQELRAFKERPWLGYGLGSTATIVNPGANIPHSDVFRLLVETGVVGFVFFGTALILLCRSLYFIARGSSNDRSYGTFALACIAGLLVHGLVNNVSTQTATVYSMAIIVGCALASRTRTGTNST